MSTCIRCGAAFGCAMVDGGTEPCWCTALPPVVPVPSGARAPAAGCWCPACLRQHIAQQAGASPDTSGAA
ncbi:MULTISPECIES: cysteine-rich CWC family protein [unclassified Massilia]|uniref:cysteine-rich CWC family protein n=1 Tax=unclassified Massilia TaxID=2609279 RepID=UPI0009E9B52E|nr:MULTISPECIES: cysteine-rich CWC family protein [unclassified Massilia]